VSGQGADWVDDALELGTSTLYEASGLDCAMDTGIRPAWPRARLCGSAFTVRCATGDNLALHQALEHVTGGGVLVVQAGGLLAGYWGEVLTRAAQTRGVRGLVIDGGLRDVDALETLGFPAFSRGVSMLGTTKQSAGELGGPLVVGGVLVVPGSLILGDADGVIAIPPDRTRDTLVAARERKAMEQGLIKRVRAGESTLDIYGLRGDGSRDGTGRLSR
jgi:4-hydroxy-4-methyl-2-oxoglutarate aldolase